MEITKALIIDTPHIDRILAGQKSWELRSTATKVRGPIALIRKGSGTVVGVVEIADSLGPLTEPQMLENTTRHMVTAERIKNGEVAKYKHAWVLKNPRPLTTPIPYEHPNGAVIWVNLQPAVVAQLAI
ncbi:ASCH domain-containing protein [Rhodoferax sediminis]|uniref:ASCH domain-containing protein n=1 Tax=Rhodoferax sediminis TaxID=2509614 RepID=A0A515D6A2_9BURK|nr:ASCH domain-containing protein [Rhodoferax sediminis]QDL35946.1 ASCH domain-containing protein [Rhodoferax sediminis]